jgi:hypothetical protein
MELAGSMSCSKGPIISPYPELDKSILPFQSYFFEINFNIVLPSMSRLHIIINYLIFKMSRTRNVASK